MLDLFQPEKIEHESIEKNTAYLIPDSWMNASLTSNALAPQITKLQSIFVLDTMLQSWKKGEFTDWTDLLNASFSKKAIEKNRLSLTNIHIHAGISIIASGEQSLETFQKKTGENKPNRIISDTGLNELASGIFLQSIILLQYFKNIDEMESNYLRRFNIGRYFSDAAIEFHTLAGFNAYFKDSCNALAIHQLQTLLQHVYTDCTRRENRELFSNYHEKMPKNNIEIVRHAAFFYDAMLQPLLAKSIDEAGKSFLDDQKLHANMKRHFQNVACQFAKLTPFKEKPGRYRLD